MATLTKRPANLPDKTYGAPVGYAYFDSTADSEADEEREPSVSCNQFSYSDDKLCLRQQ